MRHTMITPTLTACVLAASVVAVSGCAESQNSNACGHTEPSASAVVTPAEQLARDFQSLAGSLWTGTLTYRDYTTDKATTIKTTLQVSPADPDAVAAQAGSERKEWSGWDGGKGWAGGKGMAWLHQIGYTDEPHANSSTSLALSHDGLRLNDERIIERRDTASGGATVTTETDLEDNSRPAKARFVYTISPTIFTKQKLVKYDGTNEWIERHIYRFERAAPGVR